MKYKQSTKPFVSRSQSMSSYAPSSRNWHNRMENYNSGGPASGNYSPSRRHQFSPTTPLADSKKKNLNIASDGNAASTKPSDNNYAKVAAEPDLKYPDACIFVAR